MDDLEQLIRHIPRTPPPASLDARIGLLCSTKSAPKAVRLRWLAVTAAAAMLTGCVLGFQLGRQVPVAPQGPAEGQPARIYQIQLVSPESRAIQPFVFATEKHHPVIPRTVTSVTVRTGDGL